MHLETGVERRHRDDLAAKLQCRSAPVAHRRCGNAVSRTTGLKETLAASGGPIANGEEGGDPS